MSKFFKSALIYGGLSGLLIIGLMISSYTVFGMKSSASGMLVGFALMIAIFSLIFIGIKKYRDQEQGGVISFADAWKLGLAMAVVSGIAYVIGWEIYISQTGDQFITAYTENLVEIKEAKGVSGAELSAFKEKMADKVTNYGKPLNRIPITFLENFSAGFVISIVAALSMHNPKLWAKK